LVYSLAEKILLRIYFQMKRIRLVEEEIALRYPEGKMRCPTHLSIGQEITPAICSLFFEETDYCVSTHRGHAHFLAKGGSLNAMIAELYGKSTGCSMGKGGSMHLADRAVNFMGTSAIVGNSIPVGVGLGLAAQLASKDQISCVFLGDGAVEEGVFYESLNFASVRQLPVVFICENNQYSVYSNLAVRQPLDRKISELAATIGVPAKASLGYDIEHAYEVIEQAFRRARCFSEPQFVEISTYRWLEHCGPYTDNHLSYRDEAEYREWKERDPLDRLEKDLVSYSVNSEERLKQVRKEIYAEVMKAFELAESAAEPEASSAFIGVYAE